MKSSLLITGGCGKIGAYFATYAADRYRVRLADKAEWPREKYGPFAGEILRLDLQDFAACQTACKDIDVVLHLAANANPRAEFEEILLGNNVIATHNMFRAAKEAGCRRFLFASSAHAGSAYPPDIQIKAQMPVRPGNIYGATKCFGEALAAYYGCVAGLPSIALRIGAYIFPEEYADFPRAELDAFLDPNDFNDLLIRCIETPDIDFAIAHAISNNRYKRLDLTETRALFGYRPKADAFEIFENYVYKNK